MAPGKAHLLHQTQLCEYDDKTTSALLLHPSPVFYASDPNIASVLYLDDILPVVQAAKDKQMLKLQEENESLLEQSQGGVEVCQK